MGFTSFGRSVFLKKGVRIQGGVRESRFVTVTQQKTRDRHGSQCIQGECKRHFHLFTLYGIDYHMFKQT